MTPKTVLNVYWHVPLTKKAVLFKKNTLASETPSSIHPIVSIFHYFIFNFNFSYFNLIILVILMYLLNYFNLVKTCA